jgi:hypothetical protein
MMLVADRPGFSMSCAAEFGFEGEVRRREFELAFEQAIARHRLVRSVVALRRRRDRWEPQSALPPLYWNHPDAQREFAAAKPFDLTVESGARVWVNVEAGNSALRFDFHHACCDAAGGMAFIEDLFAIYDGLLNDQTPQLKALDDARLLKRGKMSGVSGSLAFCLFRKYLDFKKSLRLLVTKAVPIPANSAKPRPWKDRFITRIVPESDLVALRYLASDVGASLNDLMLVEFMCLLRDWIEPTRNASSIRDHVRVIAPMNLRDRDDMKLSAANKIGFGFVSRAIRRLQEADCGGWHEAIADVNQEMEQAVRFRLPGQFLKKLAIARAVPGWMQRCLSAERCWATAILTQLGDPTRRFQTKFKRQQGRILVGNLLLSKIVSCAPLRPMTRALLSMNTYGNEMTLTMRCDPTCIDQEVAEAKMDEFLARLQARIAMRKELAPAANSAPPALAEL